MPVPSSGELGLYKEIYTAFNDFSQGNNSLHSASIYAGFSTPDAMSDFYGYVDAVAPTVSTSAATSVTGNSMTINGNVTSDGGGTITERGFYFGTSTTATSNPKYTVSGTTGAFSNSRTGLSAGTLYRIFAFATNVAGTTIAGRVDQYTTFTATFATSSFYVRIGGYHTDRHYWYNPTSGWINNSTTTRRHGNHGGVNVSSATNTPNLGQGTLTNHPQAQGGSPFAWGCVNRNQTQLFSTQFIYNGQTRGGTYAW